MKHRNLTGNQLLHVNVGAVILSKCCFLSSAAEFLWHQWKEKKCLFCSKSICFCEIKYSLVISTQGQSARGSRLCNWHFATDTTWPLTPRWVSGRAWWGGRHVTLRVAQLRSHSYVQLLWGGGDSPWESLHMQLVLLYVVGHCFSLPSCWESCFHVSVFIDPFVMTTSSQPSPSTFRPLWPYVRPALLGRD